MIDWTDDQKSLRDGLMIWCADFSEGYLAREKSAEFSVEKWKLVCDSGLLGLPFTERWGGLGQDLLTTMYILEALGYTCRDGGLCFSITTHMVSAGVPIQRFGTEELKDRYMPGICAGRTIGAHAITEPAGGSDALNMRTTARRDGNRWILNGAKTFVSNGPVADLIVVYARTNPAGGPLGITAFLVERDTPGLAVGRPIDKMGLKTSPLAELFFEECAVPETNVIGRPGSGFLVLDHVMTWEILCSFIVNVGQMQHRLERCLEYAKSRTQFGKPIGSFQSVSNRLVDMKIGVETARMWLYETAAKLARRETVIADIAISKLLTSEANLNSALAAVQIFGGMGYMSETGLEQDVRDAVGGVIYSGTTDIQRNRIASMLGLEASKQRESKS